VNTVNRQRIYTGQTDSERGSEEAKKKSAFFPLTENIDNVDHVTCILV
jgi:hypothetical protein